MNRFISKTALSLFLALALGTLSSCGEVADSSSDSSSSSGSSQEAQSNNDSESYRVGFNVGASGSIGQMIFNGQYDEPIGACNFVLEMSLAGTTNDGIDWASIVPDEYLDGCLAGQLEAHPDAEWNN